jgi:hypothetical protein
LAPTQANAFCYSIAPYLGEWIVDNTVHKRKNKSKINSINLFQPMDSETLKPSSKEKKIDSAEKKKKEKIGKTDHVQLSLEKRASSSTDMSNFVHPKFRLILTTSPQHVGQLPRSLCTHSIHVLAARPTSFHLLLLHSLKIVFSDLELKFMESVFPEFFFIESLNHWKRLKRANRKEGFGCLDFYFLYNPKCSFEV